jgi:hypothetical protein
MAVSGLRIPGAWLAGRCQDETELLKSIWQTPHRWLFITNSTILWHDMNIMQ